jgi:hypothetical protein
MRRGSGFASQQGRQQSITTTRNHIAIQKLLDSTTRIAKVMAPRENSHEPAGTPVPVEKGFARIEQLR